MPTPTNIAFTELIKINGRLREFNFRKRSDIVYDTDTADERGTRYIFHVCKNENHWSIQGTDIPTWIMDNESLLEKIILNR